MVAQNVAPSSVASSEEMQDLKNNIGTRLLTNVGTRLLQQGQIGKTATRLLPKSRIDLLITRFPDRIVWAAFMFISGFMIIGILAALSKIFKVPFVFPSLGATAFLSFFTPTLKSASPRNAILGHGLGIISGYAALLIFGLATTPSSAVVGITWYRILAAAVSLGLAGALQILCKASHPPGAATALIVSLGIVTKPLHLVILEIGVAILSLLAFAINRLAKIDYPLWKNKLSPADATAPWSPEKAAAHSWFAAISWAVFMFVNGFLTIGILTGVSKALNIPFIFPTLGASTFLFFFAPGLPSASPRNAICGNAVCLFSGFIALLIFGITSLDPTISGDIRHVLASALALALAGALMIILKVPHPPAASTALIVSIGLISSPYKLFILEIAMILLAVQAIALNRLAFIDYPFWKKS